MSVNRPDPAIESSTLVDLLRSRAEGQPECRAYTFLLDGERAEAHLTHAELDRQARAIAALLQRECAPGDRALLLYPPGLEYVAAFFGCLYAGVIAVPAYPPHPARLERTFPRLRAIANDARPAVALTTSVILPMAEALFAQNPDTQALRWLASDSGAGDPESWRAPDVGAGTLAFFQYTSGSTAAPKGVMLTHANLLHNLALIHGCFGLSLASRGVIWLPPYHDMGLIGGILQPLYGGFPVTLMSPVDFLQRPLRWLQAISRYRATTSGGPNFAYDLCVRKVTPEQLAALDLSSWEVAFNGAEPIRPETLDRFAATFAPCGFRREAFYPCYGLAEATLIVSGGTKGEPPIVRSFRQRALEQSRVIEAGAGEEGARALVGSGLALPGETIRIVDPTTRAICAPGQLGEIWVSGPSVAQGYWERPEATAHTFQATIAGTSEGPFLRTGDLGFVQEGELFVAGRLKDLIIIRGRNHYPQDLELTVEQSHAALRPGCGAAFSVEVADEERLVVVQEVERQYRGLDVEEVAGAIRRMVAEQHEVQVYAVVLLETGAIPKTSSGKIQRHAARAGFLDDSLQKVGSSLLAEPADEPEPADEVALTRDALLAAEPAQRHELLAAYLRRQLAGALGVPAARLAVDQPFTTLGLDSLKALELKNRIETDLGLDMPLVHLIERPTVAQLADELLLGLEAADATPEAPVFAGQLLDRLDQLSDAEVDLWLQQLTLEETDR